ncbi:MAG: hypothetical protein NZ781_11195, partial [Armatimonadetes bacterium]|nr:hypothetical protein [Armatimonadota bacterium]
MERRQPVVNIRVILLTGVGLIALLGFNVAGLPKQKSGRVYYVDAIRGNDANPGTLAAPWRTLSKAAKLMSSGDTCLVRAGVYREVIYPKRGQSFIAYPGEKPLITGCDPVSGWLQHSGNIYKAPVKTKVYDVFMSYKYMHKSRWPNFNGDYLDTTFWAKAHASRVGNTRDGIERLWRLVIGGATACFHRPEMGISLSAPATASLKAARKQESLIKLWEVEPASHLLTDREDNEAYLAAQHGQAYALYFTDGGEVGLGLKGFDGKFDVRWVDINTGKRGKYETIKDGRIAKIRAPKQGHSVAAVKRIAEEIEKKSARYQNRFSWEETHCEITPDGDIKWKPKPFILEKGSSIRYIDYENGNDNNDGLTKNTPWKHHPWDEKAEGKAKECRGIHTYIFKKGVVYRGRLIARDSGTEKEPIRLTVDPDWGRGEAYIYGSVKITGGWRKCIERLNVPEADKIWYIDMKEDFVPRAIWLVEGEKVTRIPVAREPDWIEDDPDDVLRNWWVWERVIQRGNNLIGRDSKNLTNPDPNYYKGAIVWTEGDNLIVTPTPSRVIDYNPQTSEITFLRGWRQPPVRGCRYFIEDKLEFLDSPGEYYYDKERKRLYIRLPNDENPNTKTMELAKEFNLIEIINQSNIEISGISFRFNNSLPDPLLRWIDTTEIYTAAIRATGTCKNIRIHHCKFEYLTKGIRFYAKDSDDIVDKIEVTDNEFSYTEHNAVEFKDGQLWGKTIPPFGRIKEVKILRNKFYHDGARPLRDYTPFTIYVHSGEVVEIAGNILEKCYGGGINVFCGKHHDIRDVPLIKVFIHHNKVKDCLLHSNDYGGIEVWQGGPAIVYNNIVINPVGPRRGQYVWTLENKRDFTYSSANLGFAYYADGQYKGYFFNNIAIGKSNQIGTTLCNAAAFIEVGGFLHAYFNNFIYKFGCAFRKQPSLNGVQRTWYLGNYIVDISDIVFDHQAAGESKPEMDVYDTIGYLWNTFSGNPKRGIGAFAPRQPISRNLD